MRGIAEGPCTASGIQNRNRGYGRQRMGAFIGDADMGIWVSNGERDAFLDWFAEHRCRQGDTRWGYCMDGAQRWMGRCIDLDELLQPGEILALTDNEYRQSAVEFGPDFTKMLRII